MRWLMTLALLASTSAVTAADAPAVPAASRTDTVSGEKAEIPTVPLDGGSTLTRIEADKTLRVGVAVNVPWVMHNREGMLIGYSVDVARKLAADMGWKLELVTTSWPRLIHDLRTDRYDVIISGLSITPRRALLARFSRPNGEYEMDVVVNRSRFPRGDMAELAAADGKRIAVHKGTLTVAIAREHLPKAEIVEIDDEEQTITDLREGRLDGYVAEAPMPLLLQQLYPKQLRTLGGEPLGRTAHGFAARLGDRDLVDVLDAWIIANEATGWLDSRSTYWFDGTAWGDQL